MILSSDIRGENPKTSSFLKIYKLSGDLTSFFSLLLFNFIEPSFLFIINLEIEFCGISLTLFILLLGDKRFNLLLLDQIPLLKDKCF